MNIDNEKWKDVVGFEKYFKVSNNGVVYSKRTNKILKQYLNKQGYFVISTRIGGKDGTCHCFKVHRLVAEAFLNKPEDYILDRVKDYKYNVVPVNHIDGDKQNNNISNLEWCTIQENSIHYYTELDGLVNCRRGENVPNSLLTEDQVRDILENCKPRDRSIGFRSFARKYGVNKTTIANIYHRVTWCHVLV